MKKLLGISALGLVLSAALSQESPRVYTRPRPPSGESLARLNMTQAWRVQFAMDGQRDGLASVQVIPGKSPADLPQMIVQTLYGKIYLLDAESGDVLWQQMLGEPYGIGQPAAYNSHSIGATRRDMFYVFDRSKGDHRFVTPNPKTKLTDYGFRLGGVASAMPVADDESVYLVFNSRVAAYVSPNFRLLEKLQKEGKWAGDLETARGREQLQPVLLWDYAVEGQHFFAPPIVSPTQVGAVTTDGLFISFDRFERKVRYEFRFQGAVSAPAGQYDEVAYVPSDDFTLYALYMPTRYLMWRYMGGAPILRKPEVTDKDIFVSPEKVGMSRLNRETGRSLWTQRQAVRFLSASEKFVYAADRIGRLLVLDYARGSELARLDTSHWVVPVSNEWTDRLYLANHDGQIVCLRHNDLTQPVRTRTVPVEIEPKKAEEKKEPITEELKEKEIKKEKEEKAKDEKVKEEKAKEEKGKKEEPKLKAEEKANDEKGKDGKGKNEKGKNEKAPDDKGKIDNKKIDDKKLGDKDGKDSEGDPRISRGDPRVLLPAVACLPQHAVGGRESAWSHIRRRPCAPPWARLEETG